MKGKRLFAVFAQFFALSLFVLGGGYVIIAVADRVLSKRGWTRKGELLDMIPVFQTIPGIMAGHCAVFVGSRVAG
ncbi:MAG: chromate transporter, partial [Kiritimatiellae bacterium]|nr:chromate transporter [Kiritimatiellia bacterium]